MACIVIWPFSFSIKNFFLYDKLAYTDCKTIFLAFFMKILSVYLKTAIGSRFPELILLD